MAKLKTIIVDDEALALDVLEEYICKFNQLELVGRASNAVEAFEMLQNQQIDVMFLDIQMPGLTGVSFLRSLQHPPKVVFTTAYNNYAVEGFELDAVDYLLKPIPFDRFMQAVNKLLRNTQETENQTTAKEEENYKSAFIYLKEDKLMVKVLLSEILYLESQKNYVKVVTENRTVITHSSISAMEQRLPESKFLRVHRSFIIALDKIEAFDTNHFEIGGAFIPIGRNYKEDVGVVVDGFLE